MNILLGAPLLGTLQQIVLAAAQGSAFYALRRVTGSLIWAMALHGLWDFSVFVLGTSGGANPLGILTLVSALVSVIFGFLATKDASGSASDASRSRRDPRWSRPIVGVQTCYASGP